MEFAFLILVDAIVARAHPITIVVDQRTVQCQEPQCTIDIQDWLQRGLQLIIRRFVEHLAQVHQIFPSLLAVTRFDRVTSLVFGHVITYVTQTTITTGLPLTFQRVPLVDA